MIDDNSLLIKHTWTVRCSSGSSPHAAQQRHLVAMHKNSGLGNYFDVIFNVELVVLVEIGCRHFKQNILFILLEVSTTKQ